MENTTVLVGYDYGYGSVGGNSRGVNSGFFAGSGRGCGPGYGHRDGSGNGDGYGLGAGNYGQDPYCQIEGGCGYGIGTLEGSNRKKP